MRGYVAGEGRERERLEAPARANGVTLLGARADVLELVAAAGAVCLPSEAEAMPMSLLEAMALGRPVIATDVGGTAELVRHGETGYLAPARRRSARSRARWSSSPPTRPGRTRWAPPAAGSSASASRASRWWTDT